MKIVVGYVEKLKVLHNSSVICLQINLYNNYKTAGPFCLVKCRDGEIVSYEARFVFTLALAHSHTILLQAVRRITKEKAPHSLIAEVLDLPTPDRDCLQMCRWGCRLKRWMVEPLPLDGTLHLHSPAWIIIAHKQRGFISASSPILSV